MGRRPWAWCREPGCDTKLIFATRDAGTPAARTVPYEYADRAPFAVESVGCHVLIAGQAMTPGDAIEDFQVRLGISDDKARELVSGYPFHRPHHHDPSTTSTDPGSTDDKENHHP